MRCGTRGCVVPSHRTLKVGTLSGILHQAQVSRDSFLLALTEV